MTAADGPEWDCYQGGQVWQGRQGEHHAGLLGRLRGIGKTAPYFHNNSAATLEDVVAHYVEIFKFIKVNSPPFLPAPAVASTDGVHFDRIPAPEEIPALLAYLRKL